ncbi:MAG: GTPase HflX [candidate division Zixibacteria bacterium]|nr:GTPase HflX [candidate division Zixibacteria bacterium]
MARKKSYETNQKSPRAFLVGVCLTSTKKAQARELLDELAELTRSADAEVVDTLLQVRKKFDPATYMGKGLLSTLVERVEADEIDLVVLDDPLTPAQQRNLEEKLNVNVVDRSRLILDIFARRARTAEAMAQVELAQLEYLLPRLTRAWGHLSRQYGGAIGARGPGETQLEVDRRRVRDKISKLKERLKKIGEQRTLRRKGRENALKVAFVGYTNAGKSTLFNRITKSSVQVDKRLFMTLDPTSRMMASPFPCRVIFTDTVGFIRKLPHELVESFKSTLEEVSQADLLIHVIDCSDENYPDKVFQTEKILSEIGANAPVIRAFNKIDLNPDFLPNPEKSDSSKTVLLSAKSGQGVDELKAVLLEKSREKSQKIPLSQGK